MHRTLATYMESASSCPHSAVRFPTLQMICLGLRQQDLRHSAQDQMPRRIEIDGKILLIHRIVLLIRIDQGIDTWQGFHIIRQLIRQREAKNLAIDASFGLSQLNTRAESGPSNFLMPSGHVYSLMWPPQQ